ncbi:MAG TPA: hydrogenase maturation protease, partial [Myxococcales bacterium]
MKICLMGVGNVLMGDDAIGPYVLKSLEAAFDFGPDVTVLDAGTPGLDLTLFLDGFDALVVADAVQAKGKPGEVRTWRRAELLDKPLPIVMSPHEPTLREALIRLNMMGRCPREVLLVGVIPARIETGAGLSSEVRRALPIIEAQI